MKLSRDLRIVFMGTPDFAVASLKTLVEQGYNIVGVITAQDKPAGRGKLLSESAVKKYAVQNNLPVLQPEKTNTSSRRLAAIASGISPSDRVKSIAWFRHRTVSFRSAVIGSSSSMVSSKPRRSNK